MAVVACKYRFTIFIIILLVYIVMINNYFVCYYKFIIDIFIQTITDSQNGDALLCIYYINDRLHVNKQTMCKKKKKKKIAEDVDHLPIQ